jgi:uncharacterized protein (DUF1499 family)
LTRRTDSAHVDHNWDTVRVRIVLTIFTAAAVVAVIAVSVFLIVGPERVWNLFGPPDLGPVKFETLERRTTPNDALACPPHICAARSDLVPPLFAVDANRLRTAMAKVIASEPRITLMDANETALTERYVQRSGLLGFPDTIVVRYIERPEGRSTLAIYSRSQLGHSDFGVNMARLARWLGELERIVPVIR